jgi:putative ABC transport system permease protein
MALNGWLFILPMGIVALITLVTVSYQTIKSATANPVEALRYE